MILEKKETTAIEASLHVQGGSGACVEAGPGGWRRRPGARRGRGPGEAGGGWWVEGRRMVISLGQGSLLGPGSPT